ncbi:hypothetical protein [Sporosarcina sp. 6E9]|uniref:hypothetical protein n=1 Tax=Sporosarcina sp. 6E9 TaxID=2819235 RepID=UPI001B305826|nr:hypothetical protein [Sporosarcina sp. 6E9]
MVQKSLIILFMIAYLAPSLSIYEGKNENTVSAILTTKVTTTSEEDGTPISNARIIVVNSSGEVIGTELTNSEGQVNIPVTVQKDPRFPMKNMGEVTVIAVANGYNEYVDFSVPINEFDDHTGTVFIPLWNIDPTRRNEPQFLNGSFHRLTVFEMLDDYAEKIGLKRQELKVDIGKETPWSSDFKVN